MPDTKERAIVKVYGWEMLVKLVLDDLKRNGLVPVGQAHLINGTDQEGRVFVRLDLTPSKWEQL